MRPDLYDHVARDADGPSVAEQQPERPDDPQPHTAFTESVETIDHDRAGLLLGRVGI